MSSWSPTPLAFEENDTSTSSNDNNNWIPSALSSFDCEDDDDDDEMGMMLLHSSSSSNLCQEAIQAFDRIYNLWNGNAMLPQGQTFDFDLLTPDQHLVRKRFQHFQAYVKSRLGWSLKRTEATSEERTMYRIKRKTKVYFIRAQYTVPLEGDSHNDNNDAATSHNDSSVLPHHMLLEDHTTTTTLFTKSSNSAFSSPAQPRFFGGRLQDSTNAANASTKSKKNKKSSSGNRGADTNIETSVALSSSKPASVMQPSSSLQQRTSDTVDPNHTFVPLIRSPPRMTSPPLQRPRAVPAVSSPLLSPYMPRLPPDSSSAAITTMKNVDILQAAPQQVFAGGFVYGDIVRIESNNDNTTTTCSNNSSCLSTGRRTAMVVGQAPFDEDQLIVSSNMVRLQVSVQDVKLLKGMPRWNAMASPPMLDGRSHVPK